MPFHFDEIPSPHLFLKDLDYALADSQSAGTGRMGRSWVSEKGNLFISIWLKDFSLPLTWIPHWIGVSLLKSLRDLGVTSNNLQLKWPNDLMFEQKRKVAGILCEKVGEGIVAGIGVNLITAPELSDRDTASVRMINSQLNFEKLNLKLAEKLIQNLKHEPGMSELQKQYQMDSLLTPGDEIQWTDIQTGAGGSGIFKKYGNFGELITSNNGEIRSLYSEEIRLVLR
jgi:biotin-[acetyl-CoA-carboxylase] ligase BirA-like protein